MFYYCIKYLHGIKECNDDVVDDKVIQPQKIEDKEATEGKISSPEKIENEISQIVVQRKTRISLTIRHVPKTRKIKIKL